RVTYLTHLQTTFKTLQSDINTFLTQKMALDNAPTDTKDEETYGEETIDQD
ncbi:hypothetical protein GQ44DRAFT_700240, partial [Phaeosphaeriaceae sp. PMI808]